jgi:hypothetical protein
VGCQLADMILTRSEHRHNKAWVVK